MTDQPNEKYAILFLLYLAEAGVTFEFPVTSLTYTVGGDRWFAKMHGVGQELQVVEFKFHEWVNWLEKHGG